MYWRDVKDICKGFVHKERNRCVRQRIGREEMMDKNRSLGETMKVEDA